MWARIELIDGPMAGVRAVEEIHDSRRNRFVLPQVITVGPAVVDASGQPDWSRPSVALGGYVWAGITDTGLAAYLWRPIDNR
jgi:hypothetical protein